MASKTRREDFPVGSTAASLRPTVLCASQRLTEQPCWALLMRKRGVFFELVLAEQFVTGIEKGLDREVTDENRQWHLEPVSSQVQQENGCPAPRTQHRKMVRLECTLEQAGDKPRSR